MPPKPRFTKEEITEAALEIVSKEGCDALTAKKLRDTLGTSSSPIFTLFSSMKEIQNEVRNAAMVRFESYAKVMPTDMPAFKQIGFQMVRFAMNEPQLYQLLFMQKEHTCSTFEDIFKELGTTAVVCIDSIERSYGLTPEKAKFLFENVWIYTFGIGALCATHKCTLSEAELSEMLSTEFQAMMKLIESKNGGLFYEKS